MNTKARFVRPRPSRLTHAWRTWSATAIASLLLYAATAATTIQWQDYGQFVQRVVDHELVSEYGLALAHPLHFWISNTAVKLLPLQPPHSVALVSALFAAIAVANVFGVVRDLTRRIGPAVLAAAGLSIAHTWWRMSTMPEVYTITVAAFTAEMWALLRWDQTRRPRWLLMMFLANGLGLANHNLALLSLPVIGTVLLIAWRYEIRWKIVAGCAIAWTIGASLYLGLIAQEIAATRQFAETIQSALFGSGFEKDVVATHLPLRHSLTSLAFTLLSFPNLTLVFTLLGLTCWRAGASQALTLRSTSQQALPISPVPGGEDRSEEPTTYTLARRAFLAALLIHLLFVLRYDVIDQYTFLLPAYALLAIFAGVGVASAQIRWRRIARPVRITAVVLLLLTPLLYVAAVPIARRLDVLGDATRNKPYRDDYQYLFIPWGMAHTAADRMSRQAADLAQPDGLIIVEDPMAMFAVRYQITHRQLAGVQWATRLDDPGVIQSTVWNRQTVLVPARTDTPAPSPDWRRIGDLYLLDAPHPRDSATNPAVAPPYDAGTTRKQEVVDPNSEAVSQ